MTRTARTVLGSLFLSLTLFGVAGVSEEALAQSEEKLQLPSIDSVCVDQKGSGWKAVLSGPQKGPGAANNWKCQKGGSSAGVDLAAACAKQYGAGTKAKASDPNDAYTWSCVRDVKSSSGSGSSSNSKNEKSEKVDGEIPSKTSNIVATIDMSKACAQQRGSGATALLEGKRLANDASSKWKCVSGGKNVPGPDIAAYCKSNYGSDVKARAFDEDDAYSWACYKDTKTASSVSASCQSCWPWDTDIAIATYQFGPKPLTSRDVVYLQAANCFCGANQDKDYTVTVKVDGKVKTTKKVDGMNTLTFVYAAGEFSPGSHTYEICFDSANVIKETSESNNCAGQNFFVNP